MIEPAEKLSQVKHEREYRSEDLFQGDREVVIVHGEARYRLQITRAGKLILNK